MREIRYDSAFMFKYSPRDGTGAAAWPDDVPAATKQERLEQVVELQRLCSEQALQSVAGTVQEVLVEEKEGRSGEDVWKTRTRTGKTVYLDSEKVSLGTIARVRLVERIGLVFGGELLEIVAPGR
jgi:tRNA-2-methylthio-N6-dimethylallyladenosine synthase